jgi:hypothetical protein
MMTLTKAMVGTVAAGAMAVSAASPALAQHDRHRDNDGISAGEVIAGALVLGGIAAVAAAADNDRDDRYYDRDGRNYRDGRYRDYNRRGYGYGSGNPRQAVSQCVAAAERNASRYTWGRADVTDIRRVDRIRGGYIIDGRIAVQNGRYRDGRRYGNGWGNDYRGWNDNLRGYDAGRFSCEVRRGRVVNVDYSGIRRL